MSTGSEKSAWHGARPSSISKAPPSRSSNASPNPATSSKPMKSTPPAPRSESSKNDSEDNKAKDSTQGKASNAGASPVGGNIWEQRKSAAQQVKSSRPQSTGPATSSGREAERKTEKDGVKEMRREDEPAANRTEGTSTTASNPPQGEHIHTPVNGFNRAEVTEMLRRDGAKLKSYKVVDTGGKAGPWGAKANHMANGQPSIVQLSKQVSALEGKK